MTDSTSRPQQKATAGSGAAGEPLPEDAAWSVQTPGSPFPGSAASAQAAVDAPPISPDDLDALQTEEEEGPSAGWLVLRELAETIVLSLIIFLLMRQVVQNYRIESHSMEPNFSEGQFILVNKLAYVLGEPQRGDVLVFHNPNNTDEDYIKRIIALPGDTLTIVNSQVYVNDEPLDEPYIAYEIRPDDQLGPILIETDHLFVMGDNRPNSSDSRRFGQLSLDLVVGKAWLRVWPPDKWGLIPHEEPLHSESTVAVPAQ